MYKNLQFGNSSGSYDVTDLNTALSRMPAIGAVSLTIPGPKMIWHFGELGMDNSIFMCSDGVTINTDYDGNDDGDCKLTTKPQPQWDEMWLNDPNRRQVYDDWSRLISLKINEPVFEGSYSIDSPVSPSNLIPKIYIWDNALPNLKNVVILANFDVTSQNVVPNFPYTGTWYDLMDETGTTSITVNSTTDPISIPAGEFRIYGNQASTLSANDILLEDFTLYPNPTKTSFQITKPVENVSVYDITGKLIKTYNGGFPARYEFGVSEMADGMYLIKIESLEGSVTKRLIIN
jgi:hypothetical protein